MRAALLRSAASTLQCVACLLLASTHSPGSAFRPPARCYIHPGGARQPNAKLVAIQASLLASAPAVMTLDLPGVAPVTITQRADLMDSRAPVPAAAAAAPGGNASEAVDSGSTWVGEVASSPGPASVVTLTTVTASGGAVFGNVRYYDAKAKRMRTFRIAPVVKGRAGAASAGTLSPEFDAGKSVVVEYREPNLPRKMAVPTAEQLAAATAAAAPANASAPPSSPAADASAPVPPSPSPALADGGGRRRLQQSGNVRQDLLAVFTSSAAAASNGVEGIKATIRNTVAATNKAYADSGIGVTLNLVDIRMVISHAGCLHCVLCGDTHAGCANHPREHAAVTTSSLPPPSAAAR